MLISKRFIYELEEAKLILEDAMNIAGVNQVDLAECKIKRRCFITLR